MPWICKTRINFSDRLNFNEIKIFKVPILYHTPCDVWFMLFGISRLLYHTVGNVANIHKNAHS